MSELNDKIAVEENGIYQFDFTAAESVVELHALMTQTPLSDVDFIADMGTELLFIEYKNAAIEGAANPEAMIQKIRKGEFYGKIAKKFYDSLLLYWATKGQSQQPNNYVLLIEAPLLDLRMRKQLQLRIGKQLPFSISSDQLVHPMINSFYVCNLEEWKIKYPSIRIKKVR